MLKYASIAAIILAASVSPAMAIDISELDLSNLKIPDNTSQNKAITIDMEEILEIDWGGIKPEDLTSAGDAFTLPTDDDEEEVSVPANIMPTFPIN